MSTNSTSKYSLKYKLTKTKKQLVVHGKCCSIASGWTKLQQYLERYMKLFAMFQNVIYSFYDISLKPSLSSCTTEPGLANAAQNTHLILQPKLRAYTILSPLNVNPLGKMTA
jgi:hypothetical protein